MTVQLTLIAAIGEKNELGFQDDLIWKISDDLKNFKRLTLGHHLLMGRKTFESIGKALAGRTTLVLTRKADLRFEGAHVVTSVEAALEYCELKNIPELMICGGGELYSQMMDRADKLYISHIHAQAPADTFFPVIDHTKWKIAEKIDHLSQNNLPAWSFVNYQRRES